MLDGERWISPQLTKGVLAGGKINILFPLTQVLIDLPPGQALAFRWGVTASSFVFSIISFCSLMAGIWSLVKPNDDLYGNRQEKDFQCTLACLWVCETVLGR